MMVNINRTLKTDGQDAKRSEQPRRLPVRMHELLGIPKSTGKQKNVDRSENPLSQPIRIKDLFGSASCKKNRRMTTVPNATNNARRQLYTDDPGDQTCSRNVIMTITSRSCAVVNKTFLGNNSNIESQKRPKTVQLFGLSRSDGKVNKTSDLGCECLKPERMKDFPKSWEKSQTVQPLARKFSSAQIPMTNARRKLYSVLPTTPTTISNISRKSVVPNKFQTEKNVITAGRIGKSQAARKSCLLPPNSIRNKYVNLQQNETIKEESASSIDNNESRNIDDMKNRNDEVMELNEENSLKPTTTFERDNHESENDNCQSENSKEKAAPFKVTANNQIDNLENSIYFENPTHLIDERERFEKPVKNIDKKICKIDDYTEIPRPSVIVGISAKGKWKELPSLSSDSEKSSYEISRPPLRELSRHSVLLQPRLDENATSLEDLLGNPHHERGESFYRDNLPTDSFLEATKRTQKSFVNMDTQTLSWMYGNLKLAIQSTEEHLFSMKHVLRAMEDIMKKYNNPGTEESRSKIENPIILPPMISIIDTNENDERSKICQDNNVNPQISENLLGIPFVNEELAFADSENYDESRILENPDEEDKENVFTKKDEKNENIAEKPSRRSLRIAEKMNKTPKRSDDSFSRIEEELNIVHVRTKKETPRACKSGKRLDPRSRRSVREYMALKSTMNFLDTPDVKGMPTPKGEKDTPSYGRVTRRSLSRNLLIELDDLYAESPL